MNAKSTTANFLRLTDQPTNESPFDTIIQKLDDIIDRFDLMEERLERIEERLNDISADYGDGFSRDDL